jgi:hypothetical protein
MRCQPCGAPLTEAVKCEYCGTANTDKVSRLPSDVSRLFWGLPPGNGEYMLFGWPVEYWLEIKTRMITMGHPIYETLPPSRLGGFFR